MKVSAILISLLLLAGQVAAQTTPSATMATPTPGAAAIPTGLYKIASLVDTTTGAIIGSTLTNPKHVTNKTFNHFAAKRQAYYLSGIANLSFFKNFAIADVTDGTLQVGHNFTPQKADDLISSLFTVAVQSNIAHNVANLFSKNKLANDLGLPLSYTFFFTNTWTGLDPPDIDTLESQRAVQYRLSRRKTIAELTSIKLATTGDIGIDSMAKPPLRKAALAKGIADFYDSELAFFEKQFPSFRTSWLRLQVFVPLSNSTYQVAPTNSMNFQAQNTRKWSASVTYGRVWENYWNWGAVFVNGSVRVARTNSVEQKADRIKGYTQYSSLTPTSSPAQPQSNLYFDGDGSTVYIGDLDEQWTVPLQLQAIYFFPSRGDTKLGIDVQLERYAVNYVKNNVLLGIPVILKGKEDKSVNIEAQFRWRDVDKNDIAGSDRFTVGLSVALPFGSIVK